MKRDNSQNSFFQSELITSFLTPKKSSLNLYRFSRPLSTKNRLLKAKTFSNSTTELSLPIFNPKNTHVKSFLEPEQLIQEQFQLKNIIRNLRKELFNLNQENFQKKIELKEKDETILNLINQEKTKYESSDNILMNKIKKHIKQVKSEIKDFEEKNEYLKKDIKLTKINEYFIENEKIEEQIEKINSLIENGKEIKINENEKLNELNHIKFSIDNQIIIINKLNNNYENLEKEEKILMKQIEELNEKIIEDKKKITLNKNISLSLLKTNQNLQNDKTLNSNINYKNKCCNPNQLEQNYKNQISETIKLINLYKSKIKFSENSLIDLKNENIKLKDLSMNITKKIPNIENKIFLKENKNKTNEIKRKTSEEEIINKLKESLQNSKEIENELEKQIKIYKEKLNEIRENNEQIEFGIDSENPFYSPEEKNDPIQTLKLTNIQFNQFTYILFKNFEAKNINLNNNKSNFITDILNNNEFLQDNNNNNEINIDSSNFISIVDQFSKSISEVLNCENEYNIQLLKIFIGALLYNSEGSLYKLCEYFSILFSYIKEYSKEDEEKLINRITTKYKDKVNLLLKLINEGNILNNEYISLLEVKDIIDNNDIDLKDKYIEFIFYIMKKFNDKNAKLSDLKISNLSEMLNNNNNISIIKEDNIYIQHSNNNEISNKEEEKENLENNINNKNSEINNNSNDESMTEITNEEYEKIINECIDSIKNGIKKEKTSFSILFGNFIKNIKSEGKDCNVIKIEDLNEQLKIINISLSDLQLSCLCSKYSIPENVRLIKSELFEKDILENKLTLNNNEEDNKEDNKNKNDNESNNKNEDNDENESNEFEINELFHKELNNENSNSMIEKDFNELNQKTI